MCTFALWKPTNEPSNRAPSVRQRHIPAACEVPKLIIQLC